jgi:tight adherence protein C
MLLLAGAAAFCSVLIATLLVRAVVVERRQAYGALQALRAVELRPADLHDRELARPARERLLRPLASTALAVARRCTPAGVRERIRRRLVMAGSPAGWDTDRVLAVKAGALATGAAAGLGAAGLVPAGPLRLLLVATCGALGLEAPTVVLANAVQRRQALLRRALPDSIDLLTISVEAGLGFDAAIAQVATGTTGPLAEELHRTLREMQLGRSRPEAMRNLAERCGVPELSAFVLALIQADVFGVPVAGVLRVQARDQRTKRRQMAEERAMKVPIKVLFPVLFFIFPALFVVILGPAAMRLATVFNR